MKHLIIIIALLLVGCVKSDKYTDLKNKYDILLSKDSISQNENDFLINGLREFQEMDSIKSDSIAKLNNIIDSLKAKPMMSQEQFLKLYEYESLYKYYRKNYSLNPNPVMTNLVMSNFSSIYPNSFPLVVKT